MTTQSATTGQERSDLTLQVLDSLVSKQFRDPAKEVATEALLVAFDVDLEPACRAALEALRAADYVAIRGVECGQLAEPTALGLLRSPTYSVPVRALVERVHSYLVARIRHEGPTFQFTYADLLEANVISESLEFGLLSTCLKHFQLGSGTISAPNPRSALWSLPPEPSALRKAKTADDLASMVRQRLARHQALQDVASGWFRPAVAQHPFPEDVHTSLLRIESVLNDHGENLKRQSRDGADILDALWSLLRAVREAHVDARRDQQSLKAIVDDLWVEEYLPKLRGKLVPEVRKILVGLLAKTAFADLLDTLSGHD